MLISITLSRVKDINVFMTYGIVIKCSEITHFISYIIPSGLLESLKVRSFRDL